MPSALGLVGNCHTICILFGGWHEAAVREVERLGAALARQSGQEEEEAVRHLWGKLGMLLQRGNAAILANRVPSFPAPAIDGQH